ncbi:hypothetical protein DICPUDRAFT_25440 [Dictyostelium purpureum]|uniref:AB hydrolase-1 domain-containing protein n=1 Tax=Dictyostelium purpureum TaxID=5786 RepID=F0Z718_DICPU|nr:uncharacterized protein DICPUDRAFT_25440 [Dictyostelium purpureum]EGC40255.1 hypothetical protein DICPUDRAFT_25440 [Dictyostelium purpureum]|eukprot:XP_003283191.1 hypothetical protein DICPUDRAFT_25440 [Dictyostelium purpureum]
MDNNSGIISGDSGCNSSNSDSFSNTNNNNERKDYAIVGKKRGGPLKLYYETYGNVDAPVKVLFIMGFMATGQDWIPQVEYFKKFKEYEVCIFDNRGIGNSGKAKRYTTSDMALDAVELMDHLKWDTAHIVGASMGGMIAIEFAVRAPIRIRTLTLAVTHSGLSFPPLKGALGFSKSLFHRDFSKKADILLDTLFSKQYLSSQSELDPSKTKRQELIEEYVNKMNSTKAPPISTLFGHMRCIFTHYVSSSRLESIKNQDFPVLVLTGTDDYLVKPKNSFSLKNKLSPTEFIVYENCGHCVNVEKLSEFNHAIENHFMRHKIDSDILKKHLNDREVEKEVDISNSPIVPSVLTNTTAVISEDN